MRMMNAGAMREVMDQTRAGNLMDATALIQKTLGQHGLTDTTKKAPKVRTAGPKAPAARSGRRTFTCAAGSREYVLHEPEGHVQGLLLMLHGCTQTPEDFATGTAIVDAANAMGLVVVWPAQSRGDNAQSCWNWFSGADQHRDRGEPAILAGLTGEIAATHGVPPAKTYVAGMSAGGAMAVILGETYHDRFAGIGVHSGLPYACARGVNEAFAAMGGTASRHASKRSDVPVPTIVFHGDRDTTVKPANGMQVIADTLNKTSGEQTQLETRGTAGGRSYVQTTTLNPQGQTLSEHWQIQGLAHAWSGGNARGSHTDFKGPDASAEMLRFFRSLSTNEE